MCSGPGSGASRCALRLEPMRRTVGHTAPCDRSPCVGRQEPLLRAAGAHAERQETLVQEAGAAAPHGRSWAAGAALGAWRQEQQGDRSRCGGLQEFWPGCAGREEPLRRAAGAAAARGRPAAAAGHCCGGQVPLRGVAGHAVCNRSRCARRQEMAEQEPLCLVAGDTATGGRSRFLGGSWCCAGRQEPLRSRCGGCQETLHRAAGAAPGGVQHETGSG